MPKASSPRRRKAPGLGYDPVAAIAHLSTVDRTLARVIAAAGPFTMRPKPTPSLFEVLAESITHQQLNGKAAATIHGRLCDLFPDHDRVPHPERLLALDDALLRGAGLSAAKTLALRDLARRTVAGELPSLREAEAMENDAIVERLTAVRGIGVWTVEMLLMFRLGRPDVLPVDDFGVRKGFMLAYRKREMPTKQELTKKAEKWRPYRSVASWYLWRAVDLHNARKAAAGK